MDIPHGGGGSSPPAYRVSPAPPIITPGLLPAPPPTPPPAPGPGPLTEPAVVNSAPWTAQQTAAYARMASQVLAALGDYEDETAAAGRLLTTARNLADRVRGQFRRAAWIAWEREMAGALGDSANLITPALQDRSRGTTPAYSRVLNTAGQALAEWEHWTTLADGAWDAIMSPAQAAYDKRMQAAYEAMMAANDDAENSWRRMYDGAERAQTILTSFAARSGKPPTA